MDDDEDVSYFFNKEMVDVGVRIPILLLLDSLLLGVVLNEPPDTGHDHETLNFLIQPVWYFCRLGCHSMLLTLIVMKTSEIRQIYQVFLRFLATVFFLHIYLSHAKEVVVYYFSKDLKLSGVFRFVVNIIIQSSLGEILVIMVPSSTEPKPWTTTLRRFLAPSTLLLGLVNGCDSMPPRYRDSLWYISAGPTCLLVACWFGQICIQGCRFIDRSANLELEKIQNQGLHLYLEMQWTRLKVPTLLKSYGVLRIMLVVYQSWDSLTISLVGLNSDLELVLVRGCETYIALLSFTSLISVLSNFIGSIFKLFLDTDDVDDQSIGSISSILFFILALQTGLVDLEPDKRFIQIGKNCCLLLTAILHYIHSMVHPYISNLATRTGTAVSLNKKKHLRALSVCLFLILFPLGLTLILWSKFQLGTWLMAVTAFCAEVIVKVLVTLTIYSVTMYDVYYQDVLWESFDDTIFYIKAFGGTAQFFFAIFVFLNGGWVLLFEAGGCFRAVMMVIHAYYNIWLEAKSGWSTFWKRRTALEKIADMQDATKEQIEKLADVCAICYQEMTEAKLTRCSHMFHYSCLTKWLHVQDSCPMCHETLRKVDATSQTEEPLPTPVIPAELLEDSEDHIDDSTDDSELEDTEDDDLDDIQPFRPELGIYLPEP